MSETCENCGNKMQYHGYHNPKWAEKRPIKHRTSIKRYWCLYCHEFRDMEGE